MEAATEAPAERTVEATVLAFVDTVLRQEEIILNELGNKPLFLPFPFFMTILPLEIPPTPTHQSHNSLRHGPPAAAVTPPRENISDQLKSDISFDRNTIRNGEK